MAAKSSFKAFLKCQPNIYKFGIDKIIIANVE